MQKHNITDLCRPIASKIRPTPPGRLGFSDFTHAAVLQVTIVAVTLLYLLYQFALAYSGIRD